MTATYRVTVFATKGGVRSPDDPVIFTADMTGDDYDEWCSRRDREWRRREKQNGYVVEKKKI
jgi:hypothetical protein